MRLAAILVAAGACSSGSDAPAVADGGVESGCHSAGDVGLLVDVRPSVAAELDITYVTGFSGSPPQLWQLHPDDSDDGIHGYEVAWSPRAMLSYFHLGAYLLDPRCWPLEPRPLVDSLAGLANWSPDGDAFLSVRSTPETDNNRYQLVARALVGDELGDPEPLIAFREGTVEGRTAWSGDGAKVLHLAMASLEQRSRLRVIIRDGEAWGQPIPIPTTAPEGEVEYPEWGADSTSIVYLLRKASGLTLPALEIVDLDSPDVRFPLTAETCVPNSTGVTWAPDASQFLYYVPDGPACRFRRARRVGGEWRSSRFGPLPGFLASQPLWFSDSRHVVLLSEDRTDLLWVDADAPDDAPLVVTMPAAPGSYVVEYAFSPDYKTLAFLQVDGSVAGDQPQRRTLYISDVSAGAPATPREVTTVGTVFMGEERQIAWAPDSSRLSVVGGPDGMVLDIASGRLTPIGDQYYARWSPDSRYLALLEVYWSTTFADLTIREVVDGTLADPVLVEPRDLPPQGTVWGARWAPRPF